MKGDLVKIRLKPLDTKGLSMNIDNLLFNFGVAFDSFLISEGLAPVLGSAVIRGSRGVAPAAAGGGIKPKETKLAFISSDLF